MVYGESDAARVAEMAATGCVGFLGAAGVATGGLIVVHKIHELRYQYTVEYKAIKKHTPSVFAGAILIAETWLIVADKSFHGDEKKTVVVSFVAFMLFGIARHAGTVKRWQRVIAWSAWFLGMIWVPAAVCLDRHWSPLQLVAEVRSYSIEAQTVVGLSFLVFLLLPLTSVMESE